MSDLVESPAPAADLDPTIFNVDPERLARAAKLIDAPAQEQVAQCPVPRSLAKAMGAAACPFPMGGSNGAVAVQRSAADVAMRRLLFITDRPTDASEKTAIKAFERSMLISAIRCTLTYVVFPIVLPMMSFAKGVGPAIGIVIGLFALVCDIFTVRRFFAIDHKWRWRFTFIAGSVMGLLTWLLIEDIINLSS
ncbi:MAG: hypothetical protein GX868_02500 [Actinobacteria bacterium]|nr:hypothetical protein [Actinomycetota bacterium]